MSLSRCYPAAFFCCVFCITMGDAFAQFDAQPGMAVEFSGEVPPEAREAMMKQMQQRGGKPPQGKPGKKPDEKKKEGDKKPDEGKKDEKKEGAKKEGAKPIQRPEKPKQAPNPAELEVMPTEGRVMLQFAGHPWDAMIDWYSRATGREIEWQELPAGHINLRTQEPMSMQETGDLLNQLLLARGYTILDDGNLMQVVKVEGLNPAFVPRVEPRRLVTQPLHSFVRVSFPLTRFKADELVKELEAMKSQHGKLTAMTAANRIEAMDIVRNLRDIYFAIDTEENSGSREPREFVIVNLRAADVVKKLKEMFGGGAPTGPMTPQQMQQMKQMQQMQRNNRNNNQKQPNKPPGGDDKLSIVANELRNSVIVRAEPRVLVDITAAVKLLDVPLDRDPLDIKAYTLATRSPQEVSEILSQSGALSPNAIVRVDKKTKALLVSGTQFDHYKIKELIGKIDGNPRRFESIRLRRYPARQVATTIQDMMGKPKEEKKNNRNRWGWDPWSNNDDEEENPADAFRVAADVENNRLILKCNDAEFEMVMDLLAQMGEVMTRSKFASNRVVLDGFEEEDDILQRVQRLFQATSENEVILPPPVEKPLDRVMDEESTPSGEADDSETREVRGAAPATKNVGNWADSVTMLAQAPAETIETQVPRRSKAPPVIVRRNAQGKLVIESDDPAALEKFEELLRQMAPPPQDWVAIRLQYVPAYWMKLQLEDFFEDEEDSSNSIIIWERWGDDDKDEAPLGLGDEKKMRFIDDGESTLIVRNASAKQLATVRELIKLYDVLEPANEHSARFKKIIRIRYSKARVIETTLKDAFRDLLSSNDKAFQQQQSGEGEGRGRRFGPFSMSESTTSALQGTSFKGKISFGVDETTNSLIVTAEGQKLLEIVADMVDELDKAAAPIDGTRVMSIPAGLSSSNLKESLVRMFGPESVTTRGPKEGEQNGQQKPNEQQKRQGGPAMAVQR